MAWWLRFYRGCLSNFRPAGGRKQSSRLVPDNNDTKIKQWTKRLGLKWPGGFVWAAVRTSPFYHDVVAMVKYVRCEEVGRSILDNILFNTMFNLANCPVYHCRCHFSFESRAVLILSQRPQYIKNAYSRAELFSHWQRFLKMTASLSFNSSLFLYSD